MKVSYEQTTVLSSLALSVRLSRHFHGGMSVRPEMHLSHINDYHLT